MSGAGAGAGNFQKWAAPEPWLALGLVAILVLERNAVTLATNADLQGFNVYSGGKTRAGHASIKLLCVKVKFLPCLHATRQTLDFLLITFITFYLKLNRKAEKFFFMLSLHTV